MKTIVATYDNLALAEGALRSLASAGIARDHMNLVASINDEDVRPYFDAEGRFLSDFRAEDSDLRQERRGSVLAVSGILASVGLLSIPALGPLLAAGPLLSGVLAAGAGAASDSIQRLFADVGVPPGETDLYTEALRRGLVVLLVSATPSEVDTVAGIMAMYGAIDLDRLAARWARERTREHEVVRAVDAEAEGSGIYGGTGDRPI
jgi:hypothetical protein